MCSTARCSRCGKTTWRGCGQHIDVVMANVPAAQRCACTAVPKKSMLDRLRGR
jgi:hypothetical protein